MWCVVHYGSGREGRHFAARAGSGTTKNDVHHPSDHRGHWRGKDAPVENASVYLKYVEEHKLRKDRKYELNVKTNREGIAHVPDAPLGKVLIQIVADGWKTYGKWYDITETKEPIKIHLERPPKWY